MIDLSPRVLITGATDGVGLLLAQKYATAGGRVLATGRRPLARSSDVFGDHDITYIRADQSEPMTAAARILQAMDSMGWSGCDIAILNAGIGWTGDPGLEPLQMIDQQIAINLRAPVQIAHALAPRLFEANGQLVMIGSVAHAGAPKFATYAATKAGLRGFARSLREEWRGRASVQVLHPGAVRTGMHKKAGLKTGLAGLTFMRPNRAANAIMAAIQSGVEETKIGKVYGFRRGWRVPKKVRNWSAVE